MGPVKSAGTLNNLSSDDDDAKDDAYFTSEILNCLDLFSTPMALKPRIQF